MAAVLTRDRPKDVPDDDDRLLIFFLFSSSGTSIAPEIIPAVGIIPAFPVEEEVVKVEGCFTWT